MPTTTTQEDHTMPDSSHDLYVAQVTDDIAVSMAVTRTLAQVGLETNPGLGHQLSADFVATDEQDRPILSVIHLDDRRHWNLTVGVTRPGPAVRCTVAPEARLADCLYDAVDGETLIVVSPFTDFDWTLDVEILEPAAL